MTIIYRTAGAWGAGQGSNLSAAQFDENNFELASRILSLEENPPVAISVAAIDLTGNLLTFIMSDSSVQGPFIVPVARFRWVGEWAPATQYFVNDIFSYQGALFGVLLDHTSDATFDPGRFDDNGFYYQQFLAAPSQFYDVGFFYPGLPGNGIAFDAPMFAVRAVRDFYLPTDLALSRAGLGTPATEELVFDIRKNLGVIGSWSTDTGFTFTADVQFSAGDVLSVMPPTIMGYDETARDLTMTFAGVRGLIE